MIVVQVGNMGFPLWRNFEFPVGMKLGVSNKLSFYGGNELRRRLGDHIFCGCCWGKE
jgi:hypothetical protein